MLKYGWVDIDYNINIINQKQIVNVPQIQNTMGSFFKRFNP